MAFRIEGGRRKDERMQESMPDDGVGFGGGTDVPR